MSFRVLSRVLVTFTVCAGVTLVLSPATAQSSSNAPPLSGIYSLQALLTFDSLEGAEFDPSSNTLVLYGRPATPGRLINIPYFDHLAAALESDGPTFSLAWTDESRAAWARLKAIEITDSAKRLNEFGAWLLRQGGLNLSVGTDVKTLSEQVVTSGTLERMAKQPLIRVPPEILPLTGLQPPRVKPLVTRMPAGSLLAQVALEADLQAKSLSEMPELRSKIPDYRTFSEWFGLAAGGASEHTWIAPDHFEIRESTDGKVLQFGRTPMRIWIEKYQDAGKMAGQKAPSVRDPALTRYAEMLTRNYDSLAALFPVFYHLRECEKVIAVAEWVKRHGWKVNLPRAGRTSLLPPQDVQGVSQVFVRVSGESQRLNTHYTIIQLGGIDLRVRDNSTVVRLPDLGRLPVISPIPALNERIHRISSLQTEPPLPPIPDWVAQSGVGKDAMQYVNVRMNEAAERPDAALLLAQLERVKRKALLLEHCDSKINELTRRNMANQQEAAKLVAESGMQTLEYFKEAIKSVSSIRQAADELRAILAHGGTPPPLSKVAKAAKTLENVKGLLEDLNTGLEKRDKPADYWTRIAERTGQLAIEFNKQFALTDPEAWVYAEEIAARRSLVLAILVGLQTVALKLLDIQAALMDADELSARSGNDLKLGDRIRSACKTDFDDYRRERKKYEDMLASGGR
jgi:hypothetical protein